MDSLEPSIAVQVAALRSYQDLQFKVRIGAMTFLWWLLFVHHLFSERTFESWLVLSRPALKEIEEQCFMSR